MKKILLHLVILIGLLGNKDVLSSDFFDIELKSDSIVGGLWQGIKTQEEDVKELFKLVDENQKNKVEDSQKVPSYHIDNFLKTCEAMMKDTAKNRDKSIQNINNIDTFIGIAKKLSGEFSPETVKNSLVMILSKYNG